MEKQPTKGKTRPLSAKQKAFISLYTNMQGKNPITGKRTYLNGAQTALAVYDTTDPKTASSIAVANLSNHSISSDIVNILEANGAGPKVRIGVMANIVKGEYRTNTIQTVRGVDRLGNPTEQTVTTERTPTASEITKANELIERINGTFDRNKVVADVQTAELKTLLRSQRKALIRDVTPPDEGAPEGAE